MELSCSVTSIIFSFQYPFPISIILVFRNLILVPGWNYFLISARWAFFMKMSAKTLTDGCRIDR